MKDYLLIDTLCDYKETKSYKELKRTIKNAIELIELNICGGSINNAREILKILKGSDLFESINN